ncbi:MAG: PEP-CTERM sorting domain-containing protein [Verrucomicrobiales bacterium]|jgi:hypothetical protein|nr:PEP-CTERM sorting domain-containing protein [Verrucomicrobiales bacterium]
MKAKLLILSILSAAALNAFAQDGIHRFVDVGHEVYESGSTYNGGFNYQGMPANLTVANYGTVYIGNNITFNNEYGAAQVAVIVTDLATLVLAGSTITGGDSYLAYIGVHVTFGGSGTLHNVNISGVNMGVSVFDSTLTMNGGTITVNDAYNHAGIVCGDGSNITLANGSVIIGDVWSGNSSNKITLTGANTALHGNFFTSDSASNAALIVDISDGALFEGAGTVSELTLGTGAIYKYTGGSLTVTGSISIGNNVTIDLSNFLNPADLEGLTILDWSGATGAEELNLNQFNFITAQSTDPGDFTIENGQIIYTTAAVPEPSIWFLLGAGFGVLALLRLRRQP